MRSCTVPHLSRISSPIGLKCMLQPWRSISGHLLPSSVPNNRMMASGLSRLNTEARTAFCKSIMLSSQSVSAVELRICRASQEWYVCYAVRPRPMISSDHRVQNKFKGQILHSTQHDKASDHAGKKVVVIGACTSGKRPNVLLQSAALLSRRYRSA